MGSLLGKQKQDDMETPSRDSVLKRIEDPRSPTEEISRTPIEVTDDVPKESLRQLAFANSLKLQNKIIYESSPIYPRADMCDKDIKKPKYPFSTALDSIPILDAEDSSASLNMSDIEKENVP